VKSGFALEEFLGSAEARAVAGATDAERREVATRLNASLADADATLAALSVDDVHGWLFHAVPERFEPGDPLLPHVAPMVRALTAFAKLDRLRGTIEEALPELEHALEHGHSHHHHDHDEEVQEPYVRGGPKVGRNDPCPCGSGKKFKKCHGA
jgi:hypothetical protein